MIERQAEGEQQAVERIEPRQALEEQPLDDGADGADQERRQDERPPVVEAGDLEQEIGGESAHHVEGAVGEIDDRQHAENDGEAEAEQRVERAVDEPDQKLAVELRPADDVAEEGHGRRSPRPSRLERSPPATGHSEERPVLRRAMREKVDRAAARLEGEAARRNLRQADSMLVITPPAPRAACPSFLRARRWRRRR